MAPEKIEEKKLPTPDDPAEVTELVPLLLVMTGVVAAAAVGLAMTSLLKTCELGSLAKIELMASLVNGSVLSSIISFQ